MSKSPYFLAWCLFISVFSLVFTACVNPKNEISYFIDFPGGEMESQRWYDINYDCLNLNQDSNLKSKGYNLYLDIRYTDNFKFSELPLHIEIEGLNKDSIISQDISVRLFSSENKATGKGNHGLYEKDELLQKILTTDSMVYIAVCTPLKECKGIVSLGFIIKQ